jgi:hypothetical protein
MWAQFWFAVGGPAAGWSGSVGAGGVDWPESGRGQGGKHQWVGSDGFGDALAAAGGAGVKQLPHVAGVLIGAGWADCCAPVAAAD